MRASGKRNVILFNEFYNLVMIVMNVNTFNILFITYLQK